MKNNLEAIEHIIGPFETKCILVLHALEDIDIKEKISVIDEVLFSLRQDERQQLIDETLELDRTINYGRD